MLLLMALLPHRLWDKVVNVLHAPHHAVLGVREVAYLGKMYATVMRGGGIAATCPYAR